MAAAVLRLLEPARDGLAQAGHLHPLLAGGVLGRDRRARDRDGLRGGGPGAAAAGAAAARCTSSFMIRPSRPVPSTWSRREAAVGHQLVRRRRVLDVALRRGGRGSVGGRGAGGGHRRGGLAGRALPPAMRPSLPPASRRSAPRGVDLGQRAAGGRGDLDRDLVGLELAEHLVLGDGVADLLEPGRDGRLGDALAERRHGDLDRALVGRGRFRVARRRLARGLLGRGGLGGRGLRGGGLGRWRAGAGASSMVASSASTPTVWPSLATISARTPAAVAGTSTVTLSVSSSQSISSTFTASPTFLNQVATVASVTLSPSVGTRMSAMALAVLLEAERGVDQRRLLRLVLAGEAGGGRGGGRAADVGGPVALGVDAAEHPLEVGLDEGPAALVLRLLLAPDDLRLLEALRAPWSATAPGSG